MIKIEEGDLPVLSEVMIASMHIPMNDPPASRTRVERQEKRPKLGNLLHDECPLCGHSMAQIRLQLLQRPVEKCSFIKCIATVLCLEVLCGKMDAGQCSP